MSLSVETEALGHWFLFIVKYSTLFCVLVVSRTTVFQINDVTIADAMVKANVNVSFRQRYFQQHYFCLICSASFRMFTSTKNSFIKPLVLKFLRQVTEQNLAHFLARFFPQKINWMRRWYQYRLVLNSQSCASFWL